MNERRRNVVQLAKLASVGLEMGVAVAIGWGVGHWLDKQFGTKPWLMVLFLLFGVAAGFKGIYVAAREASGHDRQSRRQDSE